MRTRSLHGIGLAAPLGVVVVGADGCVVATRALSPGGLLWLGWSARWVAELPPGWPLPPRACRLGATRPRPKLAGCPEP